MLFPCKSKEIKESTMQLPCLLNQILKNEGGICECEIQASSLL